MTEKELRENLVKVVDEDYEFFLNRKSNWEMLLGGFDDLKLLDRVEVISHESDYANPWSSTGIIKAKFAGNVVYIQTTGATCFIVNEHSFNMYLRDYIKFSGRSVYLKECGNLYE